MVGHPLDQFWVDLDGTEVGEAIWVQEFNLAGMTTDLMYDDPAGRHSLDSLAAALAQGAQSGLWRFWPPPVAPSAQELMANPPEVLFLIVAPGPSCGAVPGQDDCGCEVSQPEVNIGKRLWSCPGPRPVRRRNPSLVAARRRRASGAP